MKTQATVTVKNKRIPYTLEELSDGSVHVICKSARINQTFLLEDVSKLILDLPSLIIAEQEYTEAQNAVLRFRVSQADKLRIEKKAIKKGYNSVSKYLRDVALA